MFGAAETVLGAVNFGLIKRFYAIGGCDGYEGERSYYTELIGGGESINLEEQPAQGELLAEIEPEATPPIVDQPPLGAGRDTK